jgi:putative hydrolase of the HAD superfamily
VTRPAAVVFDLIGTLNRFSAARLEDVFVEMAAALDVPLVDYRRACAAVRSDWEAGRFPSVEAHAEHVCRVLARAPDPERIAAACASYLQFTRRALEPREGALQTLQHLRASGLRVGLITNCSSEVPLVWPTTLFAPLIDAAVFSCVVGLRKPDRRIYAIACERLQVEPAQCVYVGDGGSRELSGAQAVGMRAVQLAVPDEDPRDAEHLGRETWSGAIVSRLEDVVVHVGAGAR